MTDSEDTTRRRRDRERHLRFVGRTEQLQVFQNHAVAAPYPAYNVFFFTGIGGIGKSDLLAELVTLVKQSDAKQAFVSLDATSSPMRTMNSWREQVTRRGFRTFDAAFRRYTHVSSKLHRAAVAAASGAYNALNKSNVVGAFVAGAIGEENLRGFLSQHLDGREASDYIDGPRKLTEAFVSSVNKLAATNRVFLFLDHYEYAGPEIDQWLRTLLDTDLSTNVVLVVAGRERPEKMDSRWTDYASLMYHAELQPLAEHEVEEYLVRRQVSDPGVRAEIGRVAHGLPWMMEMTTDVYRKAGGRIGHGRWDIAEARDMVVRRFLSQLSPELGKLVERLSITVSFDRDLAEQVNAAPVDDQLKELAAYSFVTVESNGRYAINNAARDALADVFRERDRNRWLEANRRTAEYYALRQSDSPVFSPEWDAAFGERMRCLVATNPAAAVNEFDRTVLELPVEVWLGHCGAALEILRSAEPAVVDPRLAIWTGQVAAASNDPDSARARFQEVARNPTSPAPLRLRCYLELVEIEHRAGQIDGALTFAQEGRRQALQSGEPGYQAILAARAAEMFGVLGHEVGSNDSLTIAQTLLPDVGSAQLAGQISLLLAHTLIFAGRYQEGRDKADIAGRRWQEINYDFGVAQADNCHAWLDWLTERITHGLITGGRAMDYFRRANAPYHIGMAALNLAELHRRRGEFHNAVSWNRYAENNLTESSGVLYSAIAKYRLGRAQLDAGNPDVAVHHLTEAARIEEIWVHEKYTYGLTLMFLAEGYVRLGDGRAVETILHAEQVLSAAQNRHGRALAPLAAARLLREARQSVGPDDRVTDALEKARMFGFTDLEASALLEQARRREPADPTVGPLLGESLCAAARFSPYLADRVLLNARRVLAGVRPDATRTFLDVVRDGVTVVDEAGRTVDDIDRARRIEEDFPPLGQPLLSQLAQLE